ncbi:MAG: LptF/LptG family permease [Pirellulaceae bacterium]|nr:LptF/LptG family permease [Pirellulaceae bacterium]
MTILTRYILLELTKVFLVTLLALVVLLVLVGVAQEAVRHGLTLGVTLRLVPFVLLNAMCFAIPGTILFSACNVFGRMAAANEVVAIKSLGIHPDKMVAPALAFGFLVSAGTVLLIEVAFTWGHQGAKRVIASSLEEIAYSMLRTRGEYSSKRFSIHVDSVDGRRLIRPTITLYATDSDAPTTISAREAELRADFTEGLLHLELVDGYVELDGQVTLRFPDTIRQAVPFADPDEMFAASSHPSHMRTPDIARAKARQRAELALAHRQGATAASAESNPGDGAGTDSAEGDEPKDAIAVSGQRLHRLETEPHRRWASGLSCLSFVFIGVPLAIRLRNADFFTTFGICFLPILLLYYPLFMFGLDGAKAGRLPPWSVWLGNIVCIIVGLLLHRGVVRH